MKGLGFLSLLTILSSSAFASNYSQGARVCFTDTGKKIEVSWACSARDNKSCVVTKFRIDKKDYTQSALINPSFSFTDGLVKEYREGYDLWLGINERDLHHSSYNLRKGDFDSSARPMDCEEVEYKDDFGA